MATFISLAINTNFTILKPSILLLALKQARPMFEPALDGKPAAVGSFSFTNAVCYGNYFENQAFYYE
jgi:hypothetical protein